MKKLKIIIIIFLILLLIPIFINCFVIFSTKKQIHNINEINDTYDIGMVLGCGIKNNEPSLMLRDRLNTAISLYEKGKIKKILISGDVHENYSEIDVMYKYLINNNIPESIILIDNKGYNTSKSLDNYRNQNFDESLIIITQKYHMYRSIYIANKLDLNVIGVYSLNVRYTNQLIRDIREILARCKDFLKYLVLTIYWLFI